MMQLIVDLEGWSLDGEDKLLRWLQDEANLEGVDLDFIQFVLIGDEQIRELNEQYLNHEGATDVITFNYQDMGLDEADEEFELDDEAMAEPGELDSDDDEFTDPPEETELSGDSGDVDSFPDAEIYVSLQTAHRQAVDYRCTVTEEVSRLLLHGVLHLAGQDDNTAAKREAMNQREDEGLARAGRESGVLAWQIKQPVDTRG